MMKNKFNRWMIVLAGVASYSMAHSALQSMNMNSLSAETMDPMDNTTDRYTRIQQMFDQGSEVSFAEVKGWWTGRCFTAESRANPANFLLAAATIQVTEDGGPEFPPDFAPRMVSLGYPTKGADFFDKITDEIREELNDKLPGFYSMVGNVSDDNGTLVASLGERSNLILKVRKYSNYYIALDYVAHDDSNSKAGDVYHACYAFKKVR